MEEGISELAEGVGQISESELAKELLARLRERVQGLDIDSEVSSKVKQGADVTNRLGQFLLEKSFTPTTSTFSGLFKLNQYSGTATNDMVKSIGHFFGKSFKPWEAVKWTRTIANSAWVLSVVGTVLSVVIQIKEDTDAAKLEQDLRESRAAVRAGFDEAAHAVELHYDKETDKYVDQTIGKRIAEIDEELEELRNMQESRSGLFKNSMVC